jgi:hypothetical protein
MSKGVKSSFGLQYGKHHQGSFCPKLKCGSICVRKNGACLAIKFNSIMTFAAIKETTFHNSQDFRPAQRTSSLIVDYIRSRDIKLEEQVLDHL